MFCWSSGEVVSGYKIRDGQWQEIGRVSPKLPQMFYDVSSPGMTIENGDILVSAERQHKTFHYIIDRQSYRQVIGLEARQRTLASHA